MCNGWKKMFHSQDIQIYYEHFPFGFNPNKKTVN